MFLYLPGPDLDRTMPRLPSRDDSIPATERNPGSLKGCVLPPPPPPQEGAPIPALGILGCSTTQTELNEGWNTLLREPVDRSGS